MATKNLTKTELQSKLNQIQHQTNLLLQMNNTLVRRAEIAAGLGKQFGGDRDLYEAFGYTKSPQYENYLNIYERDGLGTRIVDAVSDETWRERPVLVEGENVKIDELDDPGPLQKAFAELDDQFHLLSAFNEVDAACGISRFGLIFLGLPGNLEDEIKGKAKLMYVNVYDEGNALIDETSIIRDTANPRFGLPERYQIAVDDRTKSYKNVHWSRVIHVKEGTDKRSYRRVYGNPRLKNMINRLWDLEKVVGSGSEAFWLLIRKGLAITAKEGMTLPAAGTPEWDDMVDEIEEYEHGLSRIMKLMGLDVKDLGSEPVSSRDQFDVITDYLAGTARIPKRILLGSERGELASSQDEFNFGAFIKSRQSKFAEPFILRPMIDRLGELGLLKVPPKYTVVWESLFHLTDMDKSTIASNVASAISTVSGGAPETVMPLEIFAQRYLDYKPSPEDQAVIDESKTKADEANRQPPPSPTGGQNPFESLLNPTGSGNGNGSGRSRTDTARLNQILARLETPNKQTGYIHLNEYTLDDWRSEPFVMVVNQDGEHDNSAMVAFKIPDVLKVDLVAANPWMPQDIVDELHITLCYLGDIRTLPREKIDQAVAAFAAGAEPLKVEMQGIGRFVSGMENDPVVATFDSPGDELGELRQKLVEMLDASGIPYWDNHGFIPHMTMSYIAPDEAMPAETVEKLEINFDSVYLVIGGEWKEYKFGEMPPAASAQPYIENTVELNKILEKIGAVVNYDPSQPRDPKGSSTGGQWTSGGGQVSVPYPAIADSPTSFLIKYDLKELPENHIDGLRSVDFVENQYVLSRSAASGEITEAYGVYTPGSQTITLSSNKDNVGVIGGGTIVHEVGHHVHLYKLTDEGAAEWARISGNGSSARISAYARTNQGEHFAEAYRAYMLGGSKRKSLKALEPQSYKFMRNLDKHVLPIGEHANVGNWYQRYKGE